MISHLVADRPYRQGRSRKRTQETSGSLSPDILTVSVSEPGSWELGPAR